MMPQLNILWSAESGPQSFSAIHHERAGEGCTSGTHDDDGHRAIAVPRRTIRTRRSHPVLVAGLGRRRGRRHRTEQQCCRADEGGSKLHDRLSPGYRAREAKRVGLPSPATKTPGRSSQPGATMGQRRSLTSQYICTNAFLLCVPSGRAVPKGLIGFDVVNVSRLVRPELLRLPKRGNQRHGENRVALAA